MLVLPPGLLAQLRAWVSRIQTSVHRRAPSPVLRTLVSATLLAGAIWAGMLLLGFAALILALVLAHVTAVITFLGVFLMGAACIAGTWACGLGGASAWVQAGLTVVSWVQQLSARSPHPDVTARSMGTEDSHREAHLQQGAKRQRLRPSALEPSMAPFADISELKATQPFHMPLPHGLPCDQPAAPWQAPGASSAVSASYPDLPVPTPQTPQTRTDKSATNSLQRPLVDPTHQRNADPSISHPKLPLPKPPATQAAMPFKSGMEGRCHTQHAAASQPEAALAVPHKVNDRKAVPAGHPLVGPKELPGASGEVDTFWDTQGWFPQHFQAG